MITKREKQVLELLENNPLLQQDEIAEILLISRSAVAGHITNLMHKGVIQGKGYIIAHPQYVTTIGGIDTDIYGYTKQKIVYGSSNPGTVRRSPGGVGRNIAHNIALLGKNSYLISVVGDDTDGVTLLNHARKNNINVDRCTVIPNQSSATYFSLIDEQHNVFAAVNDMEIFKNITPALLVNHRKHIEQGCAIVIDCNLYDETLAWIFGHCTHRPIFVDTVSSFKASRIRPYLSGIHTLKTNMNEVQMLCGIIPDIEKNNLPQIAQWFHHQGVKRIVISLSQLGVYYSENNGKSGYMKPFDVKLLNTSGAGDALSGGLVVGYMNNANFVDSVQFAQACAAITVQSEATNNPNLSYRNVKKLMELTPL